MDLKNTQFTANFSDPHWTPMEKDTADYAWERKETGSSIVVNSYCKKYQTATLDSLTQHLFHGVDNLKIVEQTAVKTHGRDGLDTKATGSMDGVPFVIHTRVFNRDNCTYDITLIRAHELDKEDEQGFGECLNSLSFNSEANE